MFAAFFKYSQNKYNTASVTNFYINTALFELTVRKLELLENDRG